MLVEIYPSNVQDPNFNIKFANKITTFKLAPSSILSQTPNFFSASEKICEFITSLKISPVIQETFEEPLRGSNGNPLPILFIHENILTSTYYLIFNKDSNIPLNSFISGDFIMKKISFADFLKVITQVMPGVLLSPSVNQSQDANTPTISTPNQAIEGTPQSQPGASTITPLPNSQSQIIDQEIISMKEKLEAIQKKRREISERKPLIEEAVNKKNMELKRLEDL